MMSTNNILSPASGEPIIVPSQDVILGLYYMTREQVNVKGEGMIFSDTDEVHRAHATDTVNIHAKIKVRITQRIENEDGTRSDVTSMLATTVGRALFYEIVPKELPFEMVNKSMDKKAISALIDACYRNVGLKETVIFADQLMYMGFRHSTASGASIGGR